MKVVVIQGLLLAQYNCGKRGCVVQIEAWDADYRFFIEEFRQLGDEAI